jgi:transcriptional regulator CtsR
VDVYSLCDSIEKYLIRLIEKSPNKTVTIQRGRIAEEFDCAPSQINYVLTTRFNVFKGYIVESRRGGSGYVKIQKIQMDRLEPVVNYLEVTEKDLKENEVEGLLNWLEREGFITPREGSLMRAVMVDAFNSLSFNSLPSIRDKNMLRSSILREMLLQVLKIGYDYEM